MTLKTTVRDSVELLDSPGRIAAYIEAACNTGMFTLILDGPETFR
jgi:hypothetical protein